MTLEEVIYYYPEDEVEAWQAGAELSEEAKINPICLLKLGEDVEQRRIELSKNGSIDLAFAQKCFEYADTEIKLLTEEGDQFEIFVKGVLIKGILKEEKIILQFTCMFITLDNYNYVINQINEL